MEITRKPLAKIEGRKRMQVSGLTVAWQGTRSLNDWMAYVENGSANGHLILVEKASERKVKGVLARIQGLSKEELERMAQTTAAEAARPDTDEPVARPPGASGERSRRRLATVVEARVVTPSDGHPTAPARVELLNTLQQLRSRVESLEREQGQLREDIAMLRGDEDAYEGPPSIFIMGWFRAALVLIVLAIVVVISVPWLLDLFDGTPNESRAPTKSHVQAAPPTPAAPPAPGAGSAARSR